MYSLIPHWEKEPRGLITQMSSHGKKRYVDPSRPDQDGVLCITDSSWSLWGLPCKVVLSTLSVPLPETSSSSSWPRLQLLPSPSMRFLEKLQSIRNHYFNSMIDLLFLLRASFPTRTVSYCAICLVF